MQGLEEAGGKYGYLHYTPLDRAKIKASIADDQNAIFTPCRYTLCAVRSVEDVLLPDITEIASFRGRFCEQARTGEFIVAEGTLECIRSSEGEVRHRLLLGNCPQDTMIVQN
jgi:predicted nucleotidyltransferase